MCVPTSYCCCCCSRAFNFRAIRNLATQLERTSEREKGMRVRGLAIRSTHTYIVHKNIYSAIIKYLCV